MKKLMIMTVVACAAVAVQAAEVSVGVDFASAYVFRGTTFNDGAVMQPYAEISGFPIPEEAGSLAIGTWANYDIDSYDGALEEGEFSEIDYYLSYSLPVSAMDLSIGYCEYTYPSGGGDADRELSVSVGNSLGDTALYAGFTGNYLIGGGGSWYLNPALEYGMDVSDALSASAGVSVGYVIADDGGEDGFNDATFSLGASYALSESWALNGSVAYVAQLDDDVLTDTAHDVDVFGMIGISTDF